jgi:predicted transcriptional regulator
MKLSTEFKDHLLAVRAEVSSVGVPEAWIASRARISPSVICRFMRGRTVPRADTLYKIQKAAEELRKECRGHKKTR